MSKGHPMHIRYAPIAVAIGLLSTEGVKAQQPFPIHGDDGTWSALSCYWFNCNTEVYQFTDTTTLCGYTWSVLASPAGALVDTAYFRNEGSRTLLRTSSDCASREYLVYDYSMAIGDTVYTAMNIGMALADTTPFVLQAIDTVNLFDVPRRRFSLLFDRCNEGVPNTPVSWIEGIGSELHPFYSLMCICDACESTYLLLCYDSAGVQRYRNGYYNTCDTTIVGQEERGLEQGGALRAWQGADGTTLLLQLHGGHPVSMEAVVVSMLGMDGRLVRSITWGSGSAGPVEVSLQGMAPGIYSLVATSRGARIASAQVMIR